MGALRGLAALALSSDDHPAALELHNRLIELGERSPELFYNTALLLQKQGATDQAVRLYRKAVAEQPAFAEALLNLGHALQSLGQEEEARCCWRKALESTAKHILSPEGAKEGDPRPSRSSFCRPVGALVVAARESTG